MGHSHGELRSASRRRLVSAWRGIGLGTAILVLESGYPLTPIEVPCNPRSSRSSTSDLALLSQSGTCPRIRRFSSIHHLDIIR